MQIDWAHFTPIASLFGGFLIGLAATALILVNGRVLGASGIIASVLQGRSGEFVWCSAFVAGVVASGLLARLVVGAREPVISKGYAPILVAGLLVGFGARLGSGCTSGHGVCGLSRLSPRSLAATIAFMIAGFLTVFLVRHVVG